MRKRHSPELKISVIFTTLLSLGACGSGDPVTEAVRPVRAVQVGEDSGTISLSFPGRAKAAEEANLSFRVGGPLIMRSVNVGDPVVRGQIIARIDPRDYEATLATVSSNLASARAQLKAMRVERPERIRQLEAQLMAASAEQQRADADYRRVENLYLRDNAPQTDLDGTRAIRDVTRAQVATAEEELRMARSGARAEDIQAQEAQVKAVEADQRRARDALNDTSLLAPFSGEVTLTFVEAFEDVLPKQPIARVVNVSSMEMIIDLPEDLIGKIQQGDEFQCRFDAVGDLLIPARVKKISREATLTTRTFTVTLGMEQSEGDPILPGMAGSAEGRFEVEEANLESGLAVPPTSIISDEQDNTFVFVIDRDSGVARRRQVRPVRMSSAGMVLEGLQAGEWVATAGAYDLVDGQQVRVLE